MPQIYPEDPSPVVEKPDPTDPKTGLFLPDSPYSAPHGYEFMKSYDAREYDSGVKSYEVASAIFGVVSAIAYLAGPEAWPIAAALAGASSAIISLNQTQVDATSHFFNAVKTLDRNGRAREQVTAIEGFTDWAESQKTYFMSLDIHLQGYIKDQLIPRLRDFTSPHGKLNESLGNMQDMLTWGESEVFSTVITSLACLFMAHNYTCRVYANLALSAFHQGQTSEYKTHATTFHACWHTMAAEVRTKKTKLEKIIADLKKWRMEQVSSIVIDDYTLEIKDTYNDYSMRYLDTDRKVKNHEIPPPWQPGENDPMRYIHGGYQSSDPPMSNNDYVAKELKERKERLQTHVDRCFRNTFIIMKRWEDDLASALKYLVPHIPKSHVPVCLKDPVAVEEPHPFLLNASKVAFSYSLQTIDGESETTDWTPMLDVGDNGKIVPVIVVDDFKFHNSTVRTIYHKVVRKDGSTQGFGVEGDPRVEAAKVEDWGPQNFIDQFPKLPSGQ